MSNGSTLDVTNTANWQSVTSGLENNMLGAAISNTGLVLGLYPNPTTVSAKYQNITGQIRITPTIPLCEAWPSQIVAEMARLSHPGGLCLVKVVHPSIIGGDYSTDFLLVRYNPETAPSTGYVSGLAHEICHAHQHQVVVDEGLGRPRDVGPNPGGLLDLWTRTTQGAEWVSNTGWVRNGTSWSLPDCDERGWCSYNNPVEDNAQFCNVYLNFSGAYNTGDDANLRGTAPIRYAWSMKWLGPPGPR